MALQLRRGLNSQRATTSLAQGELVYVTDSQSTHVSPLYIGDGSTAGGIPVVTVVSVNTKTGALVLDTNDITEGATNKYYTTERAQDDVASMLVNGVHTGITFTYGSTQDSANRIDAVVAASGTVNYGTTGKFPYYSANGTAVSPTQNLSWDESLNTLTVDSGVVAVTASTGGRAQVLLYTSVDGVNGNTITFNRSRGNQQLPTTLISGDSVGGLNFNGFDGDQYVPTASIKASVSDTVSNNIVPSTIGLFVTGADGVLRQPLRVLSSGQTVLGPGQSFESGSGSLRIITTTNSPPTDFIRTASLSINTYFDGQDGQNIAITRARGTFAVPTPVQSGDDIGEIFFYGYDGSNFQSSIQITATINSAVSAGIVPGALNISSRNISGANSRIVKISNPTGTSNGLVEVTGTVKASVALQTAVYADTTARNTTIPVPSVGMIIFNTATGKFEGNTDGTQSGWVALN